MRVMITFCLISMVCIPAFASNLTIADQEKQYQDNLGWAQSAQQGITSKASGQLNIADYCEGNQCTNQIHNPPQKGLNDSTINRQKTTEFYSNDTAGAMQENFDKGRPDVKTDPAYQYALLGQENAYEITHGISNTYVDCDSGSQCLIKDQIRACDQPTNTPVRCFDTPYVDKQQVTSGQISFRYHGFTPIRYTLPDGVTEITGVRFPTVLSCQGLKCLPSVNNGVKFRVNNVVIHTKPYTSGFSPPNAEKALCTSGGTGLWCLKKYPGFYQSTGVGTSGAITIDILNDYGLFNGTFTIHFKKRVNVMAWQSDCSTLLPECQQTSRTCVEPGGTRTINGVPTYMSCWKYEKQYHCDTQDTCAELTECQENNRQCSLELEGVCISEQIVKTCAVKECSTTSLQCLGTTFCLDGDCYDDTPTQSTDFDKSASGLAAVSAAAEGLGTPPRIFTGNGMQCTDKAFGFADCCKDGGWGTGIGLAECSEEEKALGQAKEQGIAIALGEYCANEVLGVCTRKKQGYCVFDSKLARIVQEQGVKGQLGISLGSAESPLCEPITPEQLQKINFELIDFSDFYDDMHNSANLPSATEIQGRLQSAYGQ
ncbi:type-F conjugative transfer system mating-pair stabilization protein TraN [Vibrio parahaemolyticus]|uniref:type-F conjugative transfer system mating-pair stabilization protein TraN n=1 Tax=Vibrio parahaemolyticus TaxID=670 RepID=UPI001F40082D|nr:type-F conjugative transfer system mating-pair stabilization protein TraN [Vibrio parahaemolyticus]UJW96473.1 type-F conjugative transfer system mating-pair stabilization protein TraN [Vibrio parahaemolyticus]HBB9944287.1 type-F conjugative transfer system mating-pair stabilization protein TraN [Vibrio parahaemolyticus]